MTELESIIGLYNSALERGERAALATVVSVVGSAYRRPGAQMVVTERGASAGNISGGCLERDLASRMSQLFKEGTPRIVEYDSRDDDDIVWGLGLGCNGIVRILIEELKENSDAAMSLDFAESCLKERRSGVIATLLESECCSPKGAKLFFNENLDLAKPATVHAALVYHIREDARHVLRLGMPLTREYSADGSSMLVFLDVIAAPQDLIVFGAEHDAVPLVRIAKALNWHVRVVDTRARRTVRERFGEADEVLLCRAEHVPASVTLKANSAAVIMTHNYLEDRDLLRRLLPSPVRYLGILGPSLRTARLLDDLQGEGLTFNEAQLSRLHGPIGIDIGAERPEEIALAIVAEIKAATSRRQAGFLRDRLAPIHGRENSALVTLTQGRIRVTPTGNLDTCH